MWRHFFGDPRDNEIHERNPEIEDGVYGMVENLRACK